MNRAQIPCDISLKYTSIRGIYSLNNINYENIQIMIFRKRTF